ncbi:class I SAM-dependent methyltransferase [Rickettsiella endosymbiont of Dermanyssus gallinae]|uniref:class I SAM-dependent methyltransferase n=1 Tax=Rickettsiella endosymbiont of Dermanyssus gallinae TaxID=2856608 RepID=UPI001C533C4A|nr:class I SAM-dependent methyltransferase [Rickettsiella endosymbiont of Dermanyssus gallinae]
MSINSIKDNSYVLAVGEQDRERLTILNDIYGEASRSFLESVFARIPHPSVLCDIGCGHGHISRFIAKTFKKSEVIGIDQSERQLSEAQRLLDLEGLTNVQLSLPDNKDLIGIADFCYSRFVLMHQSEPRKLIENIKKIGNPAAYFVFEEPSLKDVISYPYRESVFRANELTLTLGKQKKINYSYADGIISDIGHYFRIFDINVVQPYLSNARKKSIIYLSLMQIAEELITKNLSTKTEIDALITDLKGFSRDEKSICSGLKIYQIFASNHQI